MPVYDDQKTRADDDELRRITGISSDEEKKMEENAVHDGSVAGDTEKQGLENLNNDKDGSEKEKSTPSDDKDGQVEDAKSLYTGAGGGKSKTSIKSLVNKKNGIAFAVVGFLISIAVAALTTLPGFIINHIRELLIGKVGQIQTNQQFKYRRAKLAKISDVFTKDGRRGSKIIAEMEGRGYKFINGPDGRSVTGLRLPDGNGLIGPSIGEHISDYMEVRHPLRTSRWKTKRMEAFYSRYKVSRAAPIRASTTNLDDPDATVRKNMAIEVDEGGADVRIRTDGDLPEGATDAQIADAEAAAREAASGDGVFSEAEAAAKRGEDLSKIDSDAARAALSNGTLELPEIAERVASSGGSFGGKAWGAVKGLGAADIADKVCTIKNRLRASVTAARMVRAASMLRYAAAFVTSADDIRNGKGSSKLVGALFKTTTQLDSNGNAIGASPGFAYALKGKYSKSKNDITRTNVAVDGKLTGSVGAVQSTTDKFPFTSKRQCGVWQNPVFQVGTAIVEIGAAIFSGGSSAAATTTAKESLKLAFKKFLQKATVKTIAKSLAKSAAIELSFEGIMALTQIYAEKTLTYNFTGQEKGAQLGDILVGGAGTMNKQRSLQAGMVPATDVEYASAEQEYIAWKKDNIKSQSFFARYLDPGNPDSVAFNSITSVPLSAEHAGVVVANSAETLSVAIAKTPSILLQQLTKLLSPKAYAVTTDEISYDTYKTEGNNSNKLLATDPAGNLLPIMRRDIEAIDPQENISVLLSSSFGGPHIDATTLEPSSSIFKNHVTNCVEELDTISRIEAYPVNPSSTNFSDTENDCLAVMNLTVRFKAHLAYLDMLDGVEAEFIPEDIGQSDATPIPPRSNTGTSAQYIPDCSVNSGNAAIACTAIDQLLGIPYSRPKRAAPTTLDPVPFLDCSAFTGMAVYRTFGTNLNGLASVGYRKNPNFQNITDMRSILPGDLIGKGTVATGAGGTGHIGIVVSYDPTSGSLVTAETDGSANPSRIITTKRLAVDSRNGTYTWAVRYIGPKNPVVR